MSTSIRNAIINGNSKHQLKLLLKHGHNPNIIFSLASQNGPNINSTPLIYTIENDMFDLFKILIESGANPEFDEGSGFFPLLAAIICNPSFINPDIIEILLESGANPNRRLNEPMPLHPSKYNTPLMFTIKQYNLVRSNYGESGHTAIDKYIKTIN